MFAHIVNIMVLVLIPMVIIHVNGNNFSLSKFRLSSSACVCQNRPNRLSFVAVGSMTVCFHYCILFLKLWSYIQVNMWCRNETNENPTKYRARSQSISIAELRKCSQHMNSIADSVLT